MNNIIRNRHHYIFWCITVLFLTACASTTPKIVETPHERMAFLSDYDKLEEVDDPFIKEIYRPGSTSPSKYTKVIIAEPQIFVARDSEYLGVSPNQLAFVTNSIVKALTKSLRKSLTITETPGPGVLVLRFAITNIKMKKHISLNPFSYTPVGIVRGLVFNDFKDRVDLKDADIELEFLDSQTNEVMGAAIERMQPESSKARFKSWSEIDRRIKELGKRVACNLQGDCEKDKKKR